MKNITVSVYDDLYHRARIRAASSGRVSRPSFAASSSASPARWQISYWDAAIVEAARALECDEVLSEDLQHGQNFGGVRVVNPISLVRRRGNRLRRV